MGFRFVLQKCMGQYRMELLHLHSYRFYITWPYPTLGWNSRWKTGVRFPGKGILLVIYPEWSLIHFERMSEWNQEQPRDNQQNYPKVFPKGPNGIYSLSVKRKQIGTDNDKMLFTNEREPIWRIKRMLCKLSHFFGQLVTATQDPKIYVDRWKESVD